MYAQLFVKAILISKQQKTIISKVSLFHFLVVVFFYCQHLVSPSSLGTNSSVCVCSFAFLALLSTLPCVTEKGSSKGFVSVHKYYSERPVQGLFVVYERKSPGCHCHPLYAQECRAKSLIPKSHYHHHPRNQPV